MVTPKKSVVDDICPECGKHLSRGYLNRHLTNVHKIQLDLKFVCPECGQKYSDKRIWGLHRRKKHGVVGESTKRLGMKYKPTTPVVAHQLAAIPSNGDAKHEEITGITEQEVRLQNHISYAYGRIEQWLETYSSSTGIPVGELTFRVAELLQHAKSGAVRRAVNYVPELRGTTAERS